MVKRYLCLVLVFFQFSCEKQSNKFPTSSFKEVEQLSEVKQQSSDDNPKEKIKNLKSSWLNPQYLTADFNGDGYSDTAYAVIVSNKKGIRIKHGNTEEEYIIGAGNDFGNGGEDFDWVEKWNLVTDKKTYEVTFTDSLEIEGSSEVKLGHTAFYIGADEVGGATVALKNGKYIWIHQAD